MKKLLAILLIGVMLLSLLAGCSKDEAETEETVTEEVTLPTQSVDPEAEVEDHINYKGLCSGDYDLLKVQEAEGRVPDFSFDSNGTTIYAYNEVTLENLTFTQVQHSLGDTNRISCTVSTEEPTAALADCLAYMNAHYGVATEGGGVYTWWDGTANYAMLTQLNDTTVQLAFYFSESAQ